MEDLPSTLRSLCSQADEDAILNWWNQLALSDRETIAAAYDDQCEECFFGPTPEGEALPVVRGGRFLPHDDAWRFADWEVDWYEYLLEHPADPPLIAGFFRTRSWLTGEGAFTVWVDWSRTRFQDSEVPPSEQQAR